MPRTSTGAPARPPTSGSRIASARSTCPSLTRRAVSTSESPGRAREEEVRVDRDAVPADADPGLVDVAVRLAVRGRDHLLDVDPVQVGGAGELVGQGDVDVPVGRVGELGELGRLRASSSPRPPRRARSRRSAPRGPWRPARCRRRASGRRRGSRARRPRRAARARRPRRSRGPRPGPRPPRAPARSVAACRRSGASSRRSRCFPAWTPGAIEADGRIHVAVVGPLRPRRASPARSGRRRPPHARPTRHRAWRAAGPRRGPARPARRGRARRRRASGRR